MSKILSEKLVLEANPDSLVIRPFFVYGPNEDKRMLMPSLVRSIYDKKAIKIDQFGGIKINPINSLDAAMAVVHAQEALSGFLNIAGDRVLTIREISQFIAKARETEVFFEEEVTQVERFLIGSNNKLKSLGWMQKITFEESLAYSDDDN
jgi:nucleoside-diphosphate-sugar epimerase